MGNEPSFGGAFFAACVRGYARMATEARTRLSRTVESGQGRDGLFRGRGERGDGYYTFFGALLAAVSDADIRRDDARQALASINPASLDLVHACAWLRTQRLLRLLPLPRRLRPLATGGGFMRPQTSERRRLAALAALPADAYPQGDPESPYARFLLTTLYTDFRLVPPATTTLDTYRLPNGLYTNRRTGGDDTRSHGVNATAAAMFLLPEGPHRQSTARSLAALQAADGSFKANDGASSGDLLSTATALFALRHAGGEPLHSAKPFLRECFRENGFFAATPDDPAGDPEYTVYGLLAMGGTA